MGELYHHAAAGDEQMKEILQILNLRLVYEPHWVGIEDGKVIYDHFEIVVSHEIEAWYLPKELHTQLREFVEKVERARHEGASLEAQPVED